MFSRIESLEGLKHRIYLISAPLLIISLVINTILDHEDHIGRIVNTVLIIYFSISFILLLRRFSLRVIEFTNLILVSVYHIITFYKALHINLIKLDYQSLGDSIIWMPLIIIYIFLVLGRKKGILYSFILFVVTFLMGVFQFGNLSDNGIDSIVQFYVANIIYIISMYLTQFVFSLFAEINFIKDNAYLDHLTGVPNRRRINLQLIKNIENITEESPHLSMIFLDIDHFKIVNDKYGHDAGDEVLKQFAQLVRDSLGIHDYFGRWGGEEFMIISTSNSHQAQQLAENIRRKVEEFEFPIVGKITCSLGVSTYQKEDTAETLFKRADKGLYISKHAGRNQVNEYTE